MSEASTFQMIWLAVLIFWAGGCVGYMLGLSVWKRSLRR